MPQAPVTLNPQTINLGPMDAFISTTPKTSLANAKAATDWKRFGTTRNGLRVTTSENITTIKSGFPSRDIQKFITGTGLIVAAEIIEFSQLNLRRALGFPSTTIALKSSPSTTVATGSTTTVVNVASASGFSVGDEIGVNTTTVYGVIKSISGNALTLYEALDASPVTGQVVKRVDTADIPIGLLSSPANVALKLTKTLEKGAADLYIFKANVGQDMELIFPDGDQISDPIGIPMSFSALSDANVETGALGYFTFRPND